jgi:hypothetical protein
MAVNAKSSAVFKRVPEFRKCLEWLYVMGLQSASSLFAMLAGEIVPLENRIPPLPVLNRAMLISVAGKVCARLSAAIFCELRRLNSNSR